MTTDYPARPNRNQPRKGTKLGKTMWGKMIFLHSTGGLPFDVTLSFCRSIILPTPRAVVRK